MSQDFYATEAMDKEIQELIGSVGKQVWRDGIEAWGNAHEAFLCDLTLCQSAACALAPEAHHVRAR
ncbi:MAG: hypothetical protein ABI542_00370, partial [Gemmatimonadota bacterium]